jgi:hypothetical protein
VRATCVCVVVIAANISEEKRIMELGHGIVRGCARMGYKGQGRDRMSGVPSGAGEKFSISRGYVRGAFGRVALISLTCSPFSVCSSSV